LRLFDRLFLHLRPATASSGSRAATEALKVSNDLIARMREYSASNDPARALLADIWAQRHNVPFMTTMYESAQEMNSPLLQKDKGNETNDDNPT
jgi:hypothetical protein